MEPPVYVKKALLVVLADQDLRTEVRELLGIEKSERDIMQLKEIVKAKYYYVKLVGRTAS